MEGDEDGGEGGEEDNEPGMWEESFGGNTDSKPHGPQGCYLYTILIYKRLWDPSPSRSSLQHIWLTVGCHLVGVETARWLDNMVSKHDFCVAHLKIGYSKCNISCEEIP